MTTTLFTTKVNLDGLMEVLGKNLYSTPTVAVRELVQNSHDACVRRKIETQESFEPAITISTSRSQNTLTIEDNGAGLTSDEITKFLATVGSGYTRLLRNQQTDETMIGYFGLGFLSAYVVSERLEVWTTSYQEPDKGWHFSSKGTERYSIQAEEPRQIGMRVVMHLSPNFQALADVFVIEKLLLRYCSLLPIPISLNNNVPINDEPPPWQLDVISPVKLKQQRLQFAQRFENNFEPLCTIPIIPNQDSKAKGLLWVQDAQTYGTSDNRNLTVFIRNMFISSDIRKLLPVWAGFVGGVIESDELTPTASREDIQKNDVYDDIADQIQEALIDGLAKISQEDLNTWRRLLTRHNEALLGAALCDECLFGVLAKDLKVPTSEGDLTIPAILGRSQNKIYVSMGEEGGYEEVIFRALMTPIVSGVRYAALSFCERYTELFKGRVIKLGTKTGNAVLFKQEVVSHEEQEKLQSLLAKPGQKIIPSRFKPIDLPMVLIPDRDYQLKQRMESEELDSRISKGVLSLARLHTQKIQGEISAYFYINLDSPLIQRLLETDGDKQQQIANLLYSFSIVMTRNTEQGIDFSETLANFSAAVLQLTSRK